MIMNRKSLCSYTPLLGLVTVEINTDETLLLKTKLNVLVDISANVNIRNKIKFYFNLSFYFIFSTHYSGLC